MFRQERVFTVILLLVTVLDGLSSALDLNETATWDEFKARFNKVYTSDREERLRMRIFFENKGYIDSYNTKEAQPGFTQTINHLTDLTSAEVNNLLNGFHLSTDDIETDNINVILQTLLVAMNSTFKTSERSAEAREAWYENILTRPNVDWRTEGRVSRVKDQGSCGSCWAFATTGALEGIMASRNRSILLSEQNLVDCSRRYGNHGCSGGLMDAALRYVRDHGLMAAREYPYTGVEGSCQFRRERSVIRVQGSAILPRGNEALLRLALSIVGPMPIAIDASPRSFHSYESGVYDDPICRNNGRSLNHAVLLVGYGTDESHGDYWIIKNSWGLKWGDRGYIKMARNRNNMCGVATYAVLPIVFV